MHEVYGPLGGVAAETRIVLLPHQMQDPAAVRARDHPKAAVLKRGVVERDPHSRQRSVPRRNISFVLVQA